MSSGEVSAALALPGVGVAVVAVAITLAHSALREAPEAGQTLGTLASSGSSDTFALPGQLVAESSDGAQGVAVASCGGGEAEEIFVLSQSLRPECAVLAHTHACSQRD